MHSFWRSTLLKASLPILFCTLAFGGFFGPLTQYTVAAPWGSTSAGLFFHPHTFREAGAFLGGNRPVSERSAALLLLKRQQLESFAPLSQQSSGPPVRLALLHKGKAHKSPWFPVAWELGEQIGCPQRCTLLGDDAAAKFVDAFIDIEPSCRELPEVLQRGVPVFAQTQENYLFRQALPRGGDAFERGGVPASLSSSLLRVVQTATWVSSYELDSHVPVSYITYVRALLAWRVPVPLPMLRARLSFLDRIPAIAAFISNCELGTMLPPRSLYIRELARSYPVHHYGRCREPSIIGGLAGTETGEQVQTGYWDEAEGGLETFAGGVGEGFLDARQLYKLRISARYRYVFSIENSVGVDYVTEKVYEVMASGAVPIYLGAPNVRDFLPHSAAILHAKDFASPAALGAHLRSLDAEEARWLVHHEWRSKPVPKAFSDLQFIANMTALSLACRMCGCVAGQLGCTAASGFGSESGTGGA